MSEDFRSAETGQFVSEETAEASPATTIHEKGGSPDDGTRLHPSTKALLQFFAYGHLPPHLQAISQPFFDLASTVANGPQNAETTTALRKLLEAKDCAVRAGLS